MGVKSTQGELQWKGGVLLAPSSAGLPTLLLSSPTFGISLPLW